MNGSKKLPSLNACYFEMSKGHLAKEVNEFFLKTKRCIFFYASRSVPLENHKLGMLEYYDCGTDNTLVLSYDEKGMTTGMDRPAFAPDAHSSYSFDQMRFYLAALDGDGKTIQELINHGIDVNKKTSAGQNSTVLCWYQWTH